MPFYVAAPLSTIDLATPDGRGIPIEERPAREVTHVCGAHDDARQARGSAIPPSTSRRARYIAGIITEQGVCRAPFSDTLPRLFKRAGRRAGVASRQGGPSPDPRADGLRLRARLSERADRHAGVQTRVVDGRTASRHELGG